MCGSGWQFQGPLGGYHMLVRTCYGLSSRACFLLNRVPYSQELTEVFEGNSGGVQNPRLIVSGPAKAAAGV